MEFVRLLIFEVLSLLSADLRHSPHVSMEKVFVCRDCSLSLPRGAFDDGQLALGYFRCAPCAVRLAPAARDAAPVATGCREEDDGSGATATSAEAVEVASVARPHTCRRRPGGAATAPKPPPLTHRERRTATVKPAAPPPYKDRIAPRSRGGRWRCDVCGAASGSQRELDDRRRTWHTDGEEAMHPVKRGDAPPRDNVRNARGSWSRNCSGPVHFSR